MHRRVSHLPKVSSGNRNNEAVGKVVHSQTSKGVWPTGFRGTGLQKRIDCWPFERGVRPPVSDPASHVADKAPEPLEPIG